jgi:hypothetical protein
MQKAAAIVAAITLTTKCEQCTPPGAGTLQAGVALQAAKWHWKSFPIERATVSAKAQVLSNLAPEIVPLVDTSGRIYVAWNGAEHGLLAVKFAGITASGAGAPITLSAPGSAATIDGAAAGPPNALVVSWSGHPPGTVRPLPGVLYASLHRAHGQFAPAVRLTPGTVSAGSGLVAFQPVTGEAVVISGAIANGNAQLQASISPPG